MLRKLTAALLVATQTLIPVYASAATAADGQYMFRYELGAAHGSATNPGNGNGGGPTNPGDGGGTDPGNGGGPTNPANLLLASDAGTAVTKRSGLDQLTVTISASEDGSAKQIDPSSWTVTGDLPKGVNYAIGGAGLVFSGTPTGVGNYPVVVAATDADGHTGNITVTFNVIFPFAILYLGGGKDVSVHQFTEEAPNSVWLRETITNEGYGRNATWELVSGTIPPGITTSISADTDVLAYRGYPTQQGVFDNIVWRVTDENGNTTLTKPASFTVTPREDLTLAASPSASQTLAASLDQASVVVTALHTAGGVPIDAENWSVTGTLPAGVTWSADSAGVKFSGRAADEGTYPVTVVATDAQGATASIPVTFTVAATDSAIVLNVSNISTKAGDPLVMDDPFAEIPLTVDNLRGTAVFSSANFPFLSGISLDSTTGQITGTLPTAQSFSYNLTVEDGSGRSTTQPVTVNVVPNLSISVPASVSTMQTLTTSKASTTDLQTVLGTVTYEKGAGTWPAGFTVDPTTGSILSSGPVTSTVGTYANLTIVGHDAFGSYVDTQSSNPFSIVVKAPASIPVIVDQAKTVLGTVGQSVSWGLAARGYPGGVYDPLTNKAWDAAGTVYSANRDLTQYGLTLDPSTGRISGTPTKSFIVTDFTVTVSDAVGNKDTTSPFWIGVAPAEALAVVSTQPTYYAFNIKTAYATDPLALVTMPVGTITWGRPNSIHKWDAKTGVLWDTAANSAATQSLNNSYTSVISDEFGRSTSFSWTVDYMNPVTLSAADATAIAGDTYAASSPLVTPKFKNASSQPKFSATGLPTGLTINPSTGLITGKIPAGAYADNQKFWVVVTLQGGSSVRYATAGLTITVRSGPFTTTNVGGSSQTLYKSATAASISTSLRDVFTGAAYSATSLTWSLASGALPPGVTTTQSNSGIVYSGYPTTAGTYDNIVWKITDAAGHQVLTSPVSFTVVDTSISLGDATLPVATKRTASYSYDFKSNLTSTGITASGVTWTLGSGSPAGLTLSNGVLSGTPTLSGTYTFDVTATFGALSATHKYTLTVQLPSDVTLLLQSGILPDAQATSTVAHPYSFDLATLTTLSNIPASKVTYSLASFSAGEAFPSGLSLSPAGKITGSPTIPKGDYQFRVTASFVDGTDENVTNTATYRITVQDEIVFAFNSSTMPTGYKRAAYSLDLKTLIDDATLANVTKSNLAWTWAVDPNRDTATTMSTLPAGLSLASGVVSGTLTNSGKYALQVTASYLGRTVSKSFILQSDLQATSIALASYTFADGTSTNPTYSLDLKTITTATNLPAAEVQYAAASDVTLNSGETAGLPPGLSLSAAGVLSGKVTTVGKYRFRVNATWTNSAAAAENVSGTQVYVINVTSVQGHVYWRIWDNQTTGNWVFQNQAIIGTTGADEVTKFQGWGAIVSTWYDTTGANITSLKVANSAMVNQGYNVQDAIWNLSGNADPYQVKKDATGAWWKVWKFSQPVNVGKITWVWNDANNARLSAILYPNVQYSDDGTTWKTLWSETITRSSSMPQGTTCPTSICK